MDIIENMYLWLGLEEYICRILQRMLDSDGLSHVDSIVIQGGSANRSSRNASLVCRGLVCW